MVLHLWPSVLSFCVLMIHSFGFKMWSVFKLCFVFVSIILFSSAFQFCFLWSSDDNSFLSLPVCPSFIPVFCVSCMMSVFSPCWFPFCLCVLLFPCSITSRFILIVFRLMCVMFSFARGVSTLPSSPLVYLTPHFVSVLCFALHCHAFSKKHFLL